MGGSSEREKETNDETSSGRKIFVLVVETLMQKSRELTLRGRILSSRTLAHFGVKDE